MQDYPLFFSVSVLVHGKGFVAGVCANGRAVARSEDSGFWLDGVEPASLSEGGATLWEAYSRFRETFCGVLFDFAGQAESYDDFRRALDGFFATDKEDEKRWLDARSAIRTGKFTPNLDLYREEGDPGSLIRVERLDKPVREYGPAQNQLDALTAAA